MKCVSSWGIQKENQAEVLREGETYGRWFLSKITYGGIDSFGSLEFIVLCCNCSTAVLSPCTYSMLRVYESNFKTVRAMRKTETLPPFFVRILFFHIFCSGQNCEQNT